MPLYEYACEQCGQHIERIQKFSDPPLTKCEKCGGKLERLISPPAIQFKGSGWYVTDYAGKSPTSPPSGSAGSGNGDKGKSSEVTKKADQPKKESEVKS